MNLGELLKTLTMTKLRKTELPEPFSGDPEELALGPKIPLKRKVDKKFQESVLKVWSSLIEFRYSDLDPDDPEFEEEKKIARKELVKDLGDLKKWLKDKYFFDAVKRSPHEAFAWFLGPILVQEDF